MMQHRTLNQALDALEARIARLPNEKCHVVQKELHDVVEQMLDAGLKPPERVLRLDDMLTEAAIEAQFDNMPV